MLIKNKFSESDGDLRSGYSTADGKFWICDECFNDFKEMLEKEVKLPVIMIDERMTSRMAHNTMLKADMSRNKRKQNVDKLAATIILQSYLDSLPKY